MKTANELRKEQASKVALRKKSNLETGMERAQKAVEIAVSEGKTSCYELTFSEDVIKELRKLGYRIVYHRACGCGDMDSHEIKWS